MGGFQFGDVLQQDRQGDLGAAGKVAIEGRPADARAFGDAVQGRVDPVFGEHGPRCTENRRAAFSGVLAKRFQTHPSQVDTRVRFVKPVDVIWFRPARISVRPGL